MSKLYKKVVYDNLHGYITLTRAEDRILSTAYYQRLRWVKQLGFSFYIFPGATHTRFSHALGVMHVMDRVLNSIGKAVPEEKLFDPNINDEATVFHRTMRLAAMLHDIGTFPFSHTIELAYINHWKKKKKHGKVKEMYNHEVLGSHILKNTNFEGGITKILLEEGIDPGLLAQIIAGESDILLANQLMHSDIDADRMDYLKRDAYYTGINYGQYDLDLLIRFMCVVEHEGKEVLAIKEEAMNSVEYFLISRYSWYSHIIDDGTGYKFDLIAAKIYEYFLENDNAYPFEVLIKDISQNPNKWFTFNDSYFLSKLHAYLAGDNHHPMIKELADMLAYRVAPNQIKIAPVEPTLVQSLEHRQELISKVTSSAQWLESELKLVDPNAWMIFDVPNRDVMFTQNMETIKAKLKPKQNPLLTRDPVKILTRTGELKLLVDVNNSLLKILSNYRNFIPRIYVSRKTFDFLEEKGYFETLKQLGSIK